MDTIVVTIVSITLLAILGSIYLEIRRQIKPRIRVSFPNSLTKISYKAKEESGVAIHMKNSGRFGFPKPAAMDMIILVYTLPTFVLKELKWSDNSETYVKKAPSGGIFGGMHYIGGETSLILFHEEEEVITVVMQMPENTGKYPVKVAISSQEGDLGIHQLEITIT
jgi:hypothetical protein